MSIDVLAGPRSTAWLARANPLSKLGAGLALTIGLLLTVDWVSASVALLCELALLPLAGLAPRVLLGRGWPILAAALVGGYGSALLAPKTGAVLLEWGPLLLTEGSLQSGVAIALRGIAIALPGVLLLASTDPTDLADALAQRLRLPHRFVLGALAAMRLVGLLVEEWQNLGMARRARGAGSSGGVLGRFRSSLGQAMALLVQAIRRASRLAVTMEAKGFGAGPRTWARRSEFSARDALVLLGGMVIIGAALAAAVMSGTWNSAFS
ncbi:energy-coupling factor transporter transmembrane protein EcfT [Paenarthrobacter sp. Z7-10]|uniref:energy-coupling factor transporter transmembrane component T family protein n=1 Tax=Paenarthrobacter sp. Z7-10 TaxID=2787635 RepID=UPI0022A930AC|nr:energy-coupling factor transporter transmembrane component T [Paenarthrobacter sp. Z7-10]MCZ2401866.1 energy-coupling factor transporter transmembrane protein EcfT [Paenarthrobacter sp. Z7-10]